MSRQKALLLLDYPSCDQFKLFSDPTFMRSLSRLESSRLTIGILFPSVIWTPSDKQAFLENVSRLTGKSCIEMTLKHDFVETVNYSKEQIFLISFFRDVLKEGKELGITVVDPASYSQMPWPSYQLKLLRQMRLDELCAVKSSASAPQRLFPSRVKVVRLPPSTVREESSTAFRCVIS